MEKVIRNGKVAVLYSPGFGAGWYSWIHVPEVLFDPEIVALVEANKNSEIPALVVKKYGDKYYTGGAAGLRIKWLPIGTQFEISEYDGSEDVRIFGPDDGFTA
jgi:hypothetical protein